MCRSPECPACALVALMLAGAAGAAPGCPRGERSDERRAASCGGRPGQAAGGQRTRQLLRPGPATARGPQRFASRPRALFDREEGYSRPSWRADLTSTTFTTPTRCTTTSSTRTTTTTMRRAAYAMDRLRMHSPQLARPLRAVCPLLGFLVASRGRPSRAPLTGCVGAMRGVSVRPRGCGPLCHHAREEWDSAVTSSRRGPGPPAPYAPEGTLRRLRLSVWPSRFSAAHSAR